MVSYTEWVSILFELNPDAEPTEVVSAAGKYWSGNKDLLQSATISEARELGRQV